MATTTHHIVFGHDVAFEVARYLAAQGLGTYGTDIRVGRFAPTREPMIVVRAMNGQMGVLSYPRLTIWVQDTKPSLARPKVDKIYQLLHKQHPPLETIAAYFIIDASDEDIRQERNFVRYPITLRAICHPKIGQAPTV